MRRNIPKKIKINIHASSCVSILAGIIIVLFATILLDYQKTVATLSNSGILLSIVLAIIAILITLWDVAGQKNNISDLKKSVEELSAVTGGLEELTDVSLKTIEKNQSNLSLISNQLIEAIKEINAANPKDQYIEL